MPAFRRRLHAGYARGQTVRRGDFVQGIRAGTEKTTFVFPRVGAGANAFVMTARKGGKTGMTADALYVLDADGARTREIEELYC